MMDNSATPLVFDGHNDALLKLLMAGGRAAVKGFGEGRDGHIDLPKARRGGFGGGFFAIFVRSPDEGAAYMAEMEKPAYDLPLPPPVAQADALPVVIEMASLLLQLEREGMLRICRSAADIRAALDAGIMAAVMHIEGAEAIDPEFHALDVLYAAGLRSLGPVWSRPTIYGEGAPFRFPSSPDVGGGLSAHGKRLIKRCNEKRIMIDLSHLNEAGFWDVAGLSDAPLVATHSNAHAICPHARNLTDKQLDAIAESDGMVGLNFAAAFLRADGRMKSDSPMATMLRHIDHLIGRLGEDRVGLGSDFDGALVPDAIGSAAGLGALRDAMRAHGYGEALVAKLAHGNWLRVLEKTWGA
ncbi:dipeptidase [Rhodobacteraceae bacterium D3-12]|nr:dipeptidase [Rhodobacteraceae bacterium D3-12]